MTRRERVVFFIALATCAVAGLFVATNAYYGATEEMPRTGGSFTEGIVGQPTSINPLTANGSDADMTAIELLFPSVNDIMESYVISPNRKTFSVTLKKDLVWDDGKPLTADDVVFTVETVQDLTIRSPQAGAWQGVIAEKTNDNEVRFTLREPYAFMGDVVRRLKIAPRHIFGAIPAANLRLSHYNLEPVGAGPWKFKQMATERNGFITEMDFVANPRYYGPQPFITSLSLRFYPNEEQAIAAWNARRIDGFGGIEAKNADALLVGHRLVSLSLPRYYAVFFNPNTHPALKDTIVRRALALAINRKKITHDAFNDYAAAADGPLTPQTKGYDASVYEQAGDSVQNARRLLEKSGWLVNPEDGIRYKTMGKNRVKLEFTAIVPDLPFLMRTITIVQSDWAAIGVKVNLSPMGAEEMQRGPLKTRNYEMAVFGNILKGNPDVFAFWHSSQKFYPGLNLALYDNKIADAILEKTQRAEQVDEAQLKKLEELIRDDAPAAFLVNPNYLYAIPNNLRGFNAEGVVSPADRLAGAAQWYVRTKRQFKK